MPIIRNGRFITEIRHGTRRIASAYQGSRRIYTDGPIQRPPESRAWQAAGNFNYHVPFWAGYLDIVCRGAGGAGGNGGSAVARAGEGGRAGAIAAARIDVRTLSSHQLTAEVGRGGQRGSGDAARGGSGGSSRVVYAGTTHRVGDAGAGGAGGRGALGDGNRTAGENAISTTLYGRWYPGATGGRYANNSTGGPGAAPGAGGAGGAGGIFGAYWNGGPGGDGGVWITALTRSEVEG